MEATGGSRRRRRIVRWSAARTSTARYARLSKIDLVKAVRSPRSSPRKSHLYPSYLSTCARSRKVAFRAHLPVVYLARRRAKTRAPGMVSMRIGKRAKKCRNSAGATKFTFRATATTERFDTDRFEPFDYHALTYYVKHRAESSRESSVMLQVTLFVEAVRVFGLATLLENIPREDDTHTQLHSWSPTRYNTR